MLLAGYPVNESVYQAGCKVRKDRISGATIAMQLFARLSLCDIRTEYIKLVTILSSPAYNHFKRL